MAPTNVSFETATEISSLPYDFTQSDINDGGVNYTVYYKFTAPTGAKVIGAWGYTTEAGYNPSINVYNGPVGSPTAISPAVTNINRPIQFQVTEGNEYFLKFTKNGNTSGTLRVRVEVAPSGAISEGDILVNDDSEGFPLAVLSGSADYTVVDFIKSVVSGEAGDILPDGELLLDDLYNYVLNLYDTDLNLVTTLTYPGLGEAFIRSCNARDIFYVGFSAGPTVKTVTKTGVFGPNTWTLTGEPDLAGIAANNTETILYYSIGSVGNPLKRWDLVGDVALTDLVAGITNYEIRDILVLGDNTIVALFYRGGGYNTYARRYNAAGDLLNTYDLGVNLEYTPDRLAYAIDDPNSFWAWTRTTANISTFLNIKVSDGSILTTRNHAVYEVGAYAGAAASVPARFGSSNSCPFIIARTAGEGGSGETPGEPIPDVIGGIYYINPSKLQKHDSYYNQIEKKIPDPTFKTALIGD